MPGKGAAPGRYSQHQYQSPPQKDDAVHHQVREYIHGSDIELAILDDGRIDIGVKHRSIAVKGHRTDVSVMVREFFEICHSRLFLSFPPPLTRPGPDSYNTIPTNTDIFLPQRVHGTVRRFSYICRSSHSYS